MEVLLVRAAVPFPCSRRSQKSVESSEKVRAQKLLTSPTESNPTKASTTVAASANRSVDPQASPFAPLPAFPLKFPWFKVGKKDVSTTMDVARDVASLALSSAHDDVANLTLSDEEKRTVHEVLSTLQSSPTELSALEVASIKTDDTVAEVQTADELAKAEAEIAKSWLHNFMKFRPLWNIRQFNTKAPRKQSTKETVLEEEGTEKTEEGHDVVESVGEEGGGDLVNCVCEECSLDTEEDKTATGGEEDTNEIAHVKIVHNRESFSKFLQSVPVAELKTVSQLSLLSTLAYEIPSIKPGDLFRHHGLRFITSSVHIRAAEEKVALEKAARKKAAEDEATGKENARIQEPEDTLSNSEASSANKEVDVEQPASRYSFMKRSKIPIESTAYQIGSSPCKVMLADDTDEMCMECKSRLEESDDTKETVDTNLIPAGSQEAKPTDVQSSRSCPCEWFICDDELSRTRNIVIQGSETVASWHANLLFEPMQFEDPKLGVMVHRGIYEAAKGLYEEVLPYVLEHIQKYGSAAQFRFTGHSLGGGLAVLLSILLRVRDTAPLSSLLPVVTFGSPYVFCGGDHLLQQLGLPPNHVQMVVMHRDIVPRSFTCDYPDHIAEVLKRINGTFRNYACLKKQKLLYAPMGVMRVIQPPPTQSPGHPFLPLGSGIYDIMHPSSAKRDLSDSKTLPEQSIELRSAHRAFLNNPHPLQILRDRSSYGTGGGISRDHDPRSYSKAVNYVLRQELRKVRRSSTAKTKRSTVWWPSLTTEFIKGVVLKGLADSEHSVNTGEGGSIGAASSGMGATHQVLRRSGSLVADGRSISSPRNTITSGSTMDRLSRYSRLIASKHVHIVSFLPLDLPVAILSLQYDARQVSQLRAEAAIELVGAVRLEVDQLSRSAQSLQEWFSKADCLGWAETLPFRCWHQYFHSDWFRSCASSPSLTPPLRPAGTDSSNSVPPNRPTPNLMELPFVPVNL